MEPAEVERQKFKAPTGHVQDLECGSSLALQNGEVLKIIVKEEEAEDEGYLCGETSTSVEHFIHVGHLISEGHVASVEQQHGDFQMKSVKEEPEDKDNLKIDTTFICSFCQLPCQSQSHVHNHIKRCHNNKTLVTKRIHTGEKPYRCSLCGKSFNQQNDLKKHQRIHTGEKPYRCLQCERSFNQHSHLKKHQRIHTGVKPHCCSKCGRSFAHLLSLKRHKCVESEPSDHAK